MYGLRNPWRFSFDRQTGDLWIGDVGQNDVEEIDRLSAREVAGANLGWNAFEGSRAFSGASIDDHVGPIAEYGRDGGCSVTGGFVGRDDNVPRLFGQYVYSDFCAGRVWTLTADESSPVPTEITDLLGTDLQTVTSFGEDAVGRLYVIVDGSVFRFGAAPLPGG